MKNLLVRTAARPAAGIGPAAVLEACSTLVAQTREHNPRTRILVAQNIPMDSARGRAECGQRVRDLSAAIPARAEALPPLLD